MKKPDNSSGQEEFIIPVRWSVYSTVVVKGAKSLEDAKRLVEKNMADIPLSRNPEYIDDSYGIDIEDDEDLEMAQDWSARGVLMEIDPEDPDKDPEYTVID